jgi:2-desacetyl-2-hydroxyethyl bacteriochlorophyllide A dehydrogenase
MPMMRAARLVEPRRFEIVEVPMPVPDPHEVLLRVRACGVCTSDTYVWQGHHPAYPLRAGAPGHEVCGSVVEIGSARAGLDVGQEVTAIAFPGLGFAEYILAPAAQVAPLPDRVAGATVLGEPLACAMNAVRRSGVMPGDSVLLIGAGYMGILVLKMLQRMGAAPIVVADVLGTGRAWALLHGADAALDPASPGYAAELAMFAGGAGVDVVVEATGAPSALDLVADAVRIRGTVVIFGYHVGGPRSIDLQSWNWKGLTVVNGHERDDGIRTAGMHKALRLVEYDRIDVDLVTHRFALEEIDEAFRVVERRPDGYLKAVIEPAPPLSGRLHVSTGAAAPAPRAAAPPR